ncbi:MAG TPA: EAL domain-containing protein [Acidimicrobiales bacterium]|nr:EAL domain-containing protein [Acidimicrobiales bacterium]
MPKKDSMATAPPVATDPWSPTGPPLVPVTREELRREARVVGLRDFESPSFEAVDRRRVQLWAISTLLLILLSSMVVISTWTPQLVGDQQPRLLLRLSVLGLTIAFAFYSFEKEAHLRRLSRLLFDERLLTTALSNRLHELSLLLEAGRAMNSVLELPQVLSSILQSALELLRGSNGSLMLIEQEGELHTVCEVGNDSAREARMKVGEGIAGAVAATMQPLLVNGRPDPSRFPGLRSRDHDVTSAMCVPLVHHDEALGVLNVNAGEGQTFSEYDLRALSLFAEQAASTIAKARLFDTQRVQAEQLAHLAFHDPLTGLANRVLFVDRAAQALTRAQRHPAAVAVLFVDLDRFKLVNDSLGHAAGDELLVSAAARLRAVVRPSDTLARFGGDEFVVLCEGLAGEIEAIGVAARIEEAFSVPFQLAAGQARVTASVGIALASDPNDEPEALVRDADTAMYRAKQRGRAGHEVFSAAMRAEKTGKLHVENCLRRAVEQDRMVAMFQPIVDLRASNRVVGAEALLRLNDADRGILFPAEFLEVAEESGLIVPLGTWILRESCAQAARSSSRFPVAAPTTASVNVNLSAVQLANRDLADLVAQVLEETGLRPDDLHLEITETALTELSSDTLAMLESVTASGVHLGIDDFGTGYSSLTYLRRFPVDFVKIDRSFVEGLMTDSEDLAIVESVIGLARGLGLTSVAEGVESEEQAVRLLDLGCDLAQGYHFGRPATTFAAAVL